VNRVLNLRNLFCLFLFSVVMSLAGAASACDYYWKTVTVYIPVEKPVVKCITRYDHCGNPYQIEVVSTRTVNVAVTKQVKVYY
jgi:hypothetical protein